MNTNDRPIRRGCREHLLLNPHLVGLLRRLAGIGIGVAVEWLLVAYEAP